MISIYHLHEYLNFLFLIIKTLFSVFLIEIISHFIYKKSNFSCFIAIKICSKSRYCLSYLLRITFFVGMIFRLFSSNTFLNIGPISADTRFSVLLWKSLSCLSTLLFLPYEMHHILMMHFTYPHTISNFQKSWK